MLVNELSCLTAEIGNVTKSEVDSFKCLWVLAGTKLADPRSSKTTQAWLEMKSLLFCHRYHCNKKKSEGTGEQELRMLICPLLRTLNFADKPSVLPQTMLDTYIENSGFSGKLKHADKWTLLFRHWSFASCCVADNLLGIISAAWGFCAKNMHKIKQRPTSTKEKRNPMQGNAPMFISRAVYRGPILTKWWKVRNWERVLTDWESWQYIQRLLISLPAGWVAARPSIEQGTASR